MGRMSIHRRDSPRKVLLCLTGFAQEFRTNAEALAVPLRDRAILPRVSPGFPALTGDSGGCESPVTLPVTGPL